VTQCRTGRTRRSWRDRFKFHALLIETEQRPRGDTYDVEDRPLRQRSAGGPDEISRGREGIQQERTPQGSPTTPAARETLHPRDGRIARSSMPRVRDIPCATWQGRVETGHGQEGEGERSNRPDEEALRSNDGTLLGLDENAAVIHRQQANFTRGYTHFGPVAARLREKNS